MNTYCDGLARRDFIRLGTATLFGLGLNVPRLLQAAKPGGRDISLIYVFLKGGMSTIDTFDLKPDAPVEFRGDFRPIKTNVAGIQIGEHLPKLAQQMDKVALIRSFHHHNSDHGAADHYMLTGYFPQAGFNPNLKPNNLRPALGSIVSRKLGPRGSVPPYVCLPSMHASAGSSYLGPGFRCPTWYRPRPWQRIVSKRGVSCCGRSIAFRARPRHASIAMPRV
jgi:hypothetical protein